MSKSTSIITVDSTKDFTTGSYLIMHPLDTRWYVRLYYWLFKGYKPTIQSYHLILDKTETTLTIGEGIPNDL